MYYGVKVPTKYVPGTTRTLRSVNPLDGTLLRVERNPKFDGGLPGGADWEPPDIGLPSQRPFEDRYHAVTSCAYGKGVLDRAGSGPRLYQGHLHYNDRDRRAVEMPMVGMPPTPKAAGLPSGLPPQMKKSRVSPRTAAASLASQIGGLGETVRRPGTAAAGQAAAGPTAAEEETTTVGVGGATTAAMNDINDDDKKPSSSSRHRRPVTSSHQHEQRQRHKYDDGSGDPASIIARYEMSVPKRVSAGELARETAGGAGHNNHTTAGDTLRPSSRAGHFVTESRDVQFRAYRGARREGRYDPKLQNAEKHDVWSDKMHVMMEPDGTTLSADAPDWFHVRHATVCNMTKKQVASLMSDKAQVPTHLVNPEILDAFGIKPSTSTRQAKATTTTTTTGISRPSTSGSGGGGGGRAAKGSRQQFAREMSRVTKYNFDAAAGGQGIRPRTCTTAGGTRRMANTADRTAVNAQFGQPRQFESRMGSYGAPMDRVAKGMWLERRGQ